MELSICSCTLHSPLNPNLPGLGYKWQAGLRLHSLHILWICTCPTSPNKRKGVGFFGGSDVTKQRPQVIVKKEDLVFPSVSQVGAF